MDKLQIPIPDFRRSYRLQVSLSEDGNNVLLKGIDTNGANYTIFKSLKVTGLSQVDKKFPLPNVRDVQPYAVQIPQNRSSDFNVQCQFYGRYQEPVVNLKVPMEVLTNLGCVEFNMVYHVNNKRFEKVEILMNNTREMLGLAEFTTSSLAGAASNQPQRGASPAAQLNNNNKATTSTAANRNKSTVNTTAKKVRPVAGASAAAAASINVRRQ